MVGGVVSWLEGLLDCLRGCKMVGGVISWLEGLLDGWRCC